MKWDNIEDIYRTPDFQMKKGSEIEVLVETDGDVSIYDKGGISTSVFLKYWTCSVGDKDIKPFKLLEYKVEGNKFRALLQVTKVAKDIDPLKCLCKDIKDIYNYEKIHILNWSSTLIKK